MDPWARRAAEIGRRGLEFLQDRTGKYSVFNLGEFLRNNAPEAVLGQIRDARLTLQDRMRVAALRTAGTRVEIQGRDLTNIADNLRLVRNYSAALDQSQVPEVLQGTGFQDFNAYRTHLEEIELQSRSNIGLMTQRIKDLTPKVANENDLDNLNSYLTEVAGLERALTQSSQDNTQEDNQDNKTEEINVTNKESLYKLRTEIEAKIINNVKSSIESAKTHFEKGDYGTAIIYIKEINKTTGDRACYSQGLSTKIKELEPQFKNDLITKATEKINELTDKNDLPSKSLTELIDLKEKFSSLNTLITDKSLQFPQNVLVSLTDYLNAVNQAIDKNSKLPDEISKRITTIEKLITVGEPKKLNELHKELKDYLPNVTDNELKTRITNTQGQIKTQVGKLINIVLQEIDEYLVKLDNIDNLTKLLEYKKTLGEYQGFDFIEQEMKTRSNDLILQVNSKIVEAATRDLKPKTIETRDLNDYDADRLLEEYEALIRDGGFMGRFEGLIQDYKKITKFLKGLSFLKIMLPEDMLQGNNLIKQLIPSIKHMEPFLKDTPEIVRTFRLLTSGDGSFDLLAAEEKKSYASALIDYFNLVTDPSYAGETKSNIDRKVRSVEKIISLLEGFQKEQSKNDLRANHWIADEISRFKKIKERYEIQQIQLERREKLKNEKNENKDELRPFYTSAETALDEYRKDGRNDSKIAIFTTRADEYTQRANVQITFIKRLLVDYGNIKLVLNDNKKPADVKRREAEELFALHLRDDSFNKLIKEWEEILLKIREYEVCKDNPNQKLTIDQKTEVKGRLMSELRNLFGLDDKP